jgi:hypothetical protein
MVNVKEITQAVEAILKEKLQNYLVERNPIRPSDPWKATVNKAWIGVYRGSTDYVGYAVGSMPWMANLTFVIEIQTASLTSAEDSEDKLLDAEKAVLDIINTNRNLSGVVDLLTGYNIDYEINQLGSKVYYQAAIITVRAQVRTS